MAIKLKDESSISSSSSSSSPSSSRIVSNTSVQWEQAPTIFTKRSGVIMEIWGPTMTGRTTLALTAPGPIALISFHEKIDGIVQAQADKKDIRIFKAGRIFRGTPQQIQSEAWEAMSAYEGAYYQAFEWAKTIIVDTHPEAWYLERLAEFGAEKPATGRIDRNWAGINNRWMSMLNKARSQDGNDHSQTNVIFIGQVEDEWKDGEGGIGKKTGRLIRTSTKASDQVLLKSDISVRTDKSRGNFTSTIYKGWWNASSEDMVLENEMSNFGMIMGLVTETDPDEWTEER
jgi:hypothetical protein